MYSRNDSGRVSHTKRCRRHADDSVSEAKSELEKYVTLYNQRRPHTARVDTTLDACYFASVPALRQAV